MNWQVGAYSFTDSWASSFSLFSGVSCFSLPVRWSVTCEFVRSGGTWGKAGGTPAGAAAAPAPSTPRKSMIGAAIYERKIVWWRKPKKASNLLNRDWKFEALSQNGYGTNQYK